MELMQVLAGGPASPAINQLRPAWTNMEIMLVHAGGPATPAPTSKDQQEAAWTSIDQHDFHVCPEDFSSFQLFFLFNLKLTL